MVGRTLGRYELLSLLGAGGMGEVYRARDTQLGREVAIKILPGHLAGNREALARFEREAKAVAALSHPNILAIHDFGTEEGVRYAVMELLEGESLRHRLALGALPWRKAVETAIGVAQGLAAAHDRGVIHRDLKPENIFLTTDGQVKILDFGLARMAPSAVDAEQETLPPAEATKPGTVMGTPGYMSPEQVRGEPVGPASDIFSLGCVLYEMVAGVRPFARKTAAETLAAIMRDDPAPIATSGTGVREELDRALRHCLEKSPGERFQSARDLAFALRALVTGGTSAPATAAPAPASASAPAPTRTHIRSLTWVAAAVALFIIAVLAVVRGVGLRGNVIDSLAVLPLVNAGGGEDTEYLSDGIAESIINSLSKLPKLRVMARSTVWSYKGKEFDPLQVGRDLDVRAVLAGRMSQREGKFSIVVELVRIADGSQLWGQQYQRELSDILNIQEEIVRQIASSLRIKTTNEEEERLTKRPTENTEAYQEYLKGRYYSLKWTGEGFRQGIEHLRRAIDIDPSYALAYAGLATCYYEASGFYPPSEAMPKARAAAAQALKLDETLPEAHFAMGLVEAQFDRNWAAAERSYRQAIELNPSFAPAHQYYGWLSILQGRMDTGIAEMKRARELDPLTPLISTNLGYFYYLARQYDKAITELQGVIDMNPNFVPAHYSLAMVHLQQAKFAEALAELDKATSLDPENTNLLGLRGYLYAVSGRRDEAMKTLDQLKERAKERHVDPIFMARVYAGLGDKDLAFAWLDRAYDDGSEELLLIKSEPIYDPLRSDPRFPDLVRRVGLPL